MGRNIGADAKRSFRKRPFASSACASSDAAFCAISRIFAARTVSWSTTIWRAVRPPSIGALVRYAAGTAR